MLAVPGSSAAQDDTEYTLSGMIFYRLRYVYRGDALPFNTSYLTVYPQNTRGTVSNIHD